MQVYFQFNHTTSVGSCIHIWVIAPIDLITDRPQFKVRTKRFTGKQEENHKS